MTQFRGWCASILLAAGCAIAATWGLTIEHLLHEQRQAEARAKSVDANLAVALEEHAIRTIGSVDQVLSFVVRQYRMEGTKLDLPKLLREVPLGPYVYSTLGIADDEGRVVMHWLDTSPNVNVRDRNWFAMHRENGSRGLLIDVPVMGRLSGRPTIPVSKRIDNPDGSFGGVVFMGINTSYFTDFFAEADLGKSGAMMLVGRDGIVRARYVPTEGPSFGQDMTNSTLTRGLNEGPIGSYVTGASDTLETTRRFFSYRSVPKYGVVVMVGTAESELRGEITARKGTNYLIATLASFFIGAAAAALILMLRRQRHFIDELELKNTVLATQQDTSLDGMLLVDQRGRITAYNRPFAELWKIPQELLEHSADARVLESVTPQLRDPEHFAARVQYLYEHNEEKSHEHIELRDGRTIERYSAPVRAHNGTYFGRVWYLRDISERKKAEDSLRLHAKVFENIADAVVITDAHSCIQSVNAAFTRVTGYSAEEVFGRTPALLRSGRQDAAFYAELWSTLNKHGHWQGEIWNRRKDGVLFAALLSITALRDPDGSVSRYAAVFNDISPLKHYQEKLRYLAHHDVLTGLPNRALFAARTADAMARARRHGDNFAVLFIDLDHFKNVNDSLGHAAGDLLLQQVGQRARDSLRDTDTVARLGGDEFAVLLQRIPDERRAEAVAQKLISMLALPFVVGAHELFVTASIGVACYPSNGKDVDELLRNADAAMYRAKAEGRNNSRLFATGLNDRAYEVLMVTNALRCAIERDELALHYQLRYDLSTGRISGAEALARWHHPTMGDIPPAKFIPIAESAGLIGDIGMWVLRTACRQMKAWQDAGLGIARMAVNLSARQFRDPRLIENVASVLEECELDASLLELEVTESVMMSDPDDAARTLEKLHVMGVSISIDDFGTGYSSLSYLKRFPISYVKIDRSFIAGVPAHVDDVGIVHAIIALARTLKLGIIAEGVESVEQHVFLQECGCHEAQGYLFSKPVEPRELEQIVRREVRGRRPALVIAESDAA